ncbi:MAG: glutamate racemase [Candidatus Moranbacteria bacterium RIFCSPLOWO2_02_FULL_48_19]|nr:MAG: glutamate racemase [Candidatus Moranbacteria bacterium RIFCSPLOWO2_02_FULL_48_19]OGI29894.1 MAG: glutamate racemase [Candidatus Moranbacteria bacterium RIFCSPLOWO2_12_FULL_48_12]
MNIGFFDSGLGGLFVLHHVIQKLPAYHYVFLGDTVNVPYGTKSDEEIYTLVKKSLCMFFDHNCQLVIFACNTASVTALKHIQNEFLPEFFPDRKVLGVIIPTVEEAIARESKTVAIIGTERTIRSGKYNRELSKLDPRINVIALATPTLVPLIEQGLLPKAEEEAIALIRNKILPASPDTLILGCTHYGLLKVKLRETFPDLRILAQEEIIPEKLKSYLAKHSEIEGVLARDSRREFFLTKITPTYTEAIHQWIGEFPITSYTPKP